MPASMRAAMFAEFLGIDSAFLQNADLIWSIVFMSNVSMNNASHPYKILDSTSEKYSFF